MTTTFNGLDKMESRMPEARTAMAESLRALQDVYGKNLILICIFFRL